MNGGTEAEARGTFENGVSSLVKPHGNQQLPSEFTDSGELADGLLVHAHRVVRGEYVSRRALLDVTRTAHARNVSDAGERCAVDSLRRSTVKWDGTSAT